MNPEAHVSLVHKGICVCVCHTHCKHVHNYNPANTMLVVMLVVLVVFHAGKICSSSSMLRAHTHQQTCPQRFTKQALHFSHAYLLTGAPHHILSTQEQDSSRTQEDAAS